MLLGKNNSSKHPNFIISTGNETNFVLSKYRCVKVFKFEISFGNAKISFSERLNNVRLCKSNNSIGNSV